MDMPPWDEEYMKTAALRKREKLDGPVEYVDLQ